MLYSSLVSLSKPEPSHYWIFWTCFLCHDVCPCPPLSPSCAQTQHLLVRLTLVSSSRPVTVCFKSSMVSNNMFLSSWSFSTWSLRVVPSTSTSLEMRKGRRERGEERRREEEKDEKEENFRKKREGERERKEMKEDLWAMTLHQLTKTDKWRSW